MAPPLAATPGRDSRVVAMIGFMGAGKSTAARSAAKALGAVAFDVDCVIEDRLGKPIERLFAEDGEAAFRAAEERITLELLAGPEHRVVALGGGAVSSPAIRDALRRHLTVWIDVSPEVAWSRCEGSGRPLAADRAQFERLYAERRPLYSGLADV